MLAEACLNDVDAFLLRRNLTHTRYVDDFRIFCRDQREALWTLHDLCDYLYTAHRLALNTAKTKILSCQDFVDHELLDPEEEEERGRLDRVNQLIEGIVARIGGYGALEQAVDPEELLNDEDEDRAVRENIAELFQNVLLPGRLQLGVARHLLRRAAHLRTNVIHHLVFENLATLVPVFRDVVNYLKSTRRASKDRGTEFADFLECHDLGQLPFSRLWGVELLSSIPQIVEDNRGMRLAETSHPSVATRCAASIAKAVGLVDWVRERKENWSNFGPWDRRSIIFAASALPRDERNPWLSVVQESGDSLDKAVAQYVCACS